MPGTRFTTRLTWAVTAVAAAALVAACTTTGGAAAGTAPASSTAPSVTPSPSSLPPAQVPDRPEVPNVEAGEFWRIVGGDNEMSQRFSTLPSLAAAADVVVVGTVAGLREGREVAFSESGETMYLAELRVAVDEVLHGNLISSPDEPGVAVVETSFQGFAPNPEQLAQMRESTPVGSRVVLFLVNAEADADRRGAPDDAPYRTADHVYVLPNGTEAVVRDDGGTVAVGPGPDAPRWQVELQGRRFDDAVRSIRETVARS